MAECSLGPLNLLPMLFVSIVVISTLTQNSELVICLACSVTGFVWIAINMAALILRSSRNHQRNHPPEMIIAYRAIPTITSAPRLRREGAAPFVDEDVMAQRGQYSQDTRLVPTFDERAHIARMAMRALPPVKSFIEDETTGSKPADCPVRMEVFTNGELIQPFGLCAHEFHSSCFNSWLHSGKTSCPVCRKDLTTPAMLSRGT